MIGKLFGKYKIVSKIGQGGMGQVYKAVQEGLEREVAIKVLPPNLLSNPEMVARFKREIQICGKLQHPNLVKVYDEGVQDGVHFFAMEYFPGESLHKFLQKQGPLPVEVALRIVGEVVTAIGHIHQEGLIHRDVKPSNVMVSADGAAKLMDFGLARDLAKSAMTQSGALLGTLGYMSPEMIRGDKVDQRSDLYQVGVVLFELLTRKLPLDHDQVLLVAQADVPVTPTRARVLRKDVPEAVDNLLSNCLTLYPEDRYQRAKDMLKDVERAQAGKDVPLSPAVVKRNAATPIRPATRPGLQRNTGRTAAASKVPTEAPEPSPEDMMKAVRKARKKGKGSHWRLWAEALGLAFLGWLIVGGLWFAFNYKSEQPPSPTFSISTDAPAK